MTTTTTTKKTKPARQTLRKWLLVISFVLIPVTIFYISPIVILMGASEGIATGSLLLYIVLFILSLFVARLWCGWLCPMGGWQEICSPLIRKTVKPGWRNAVKYLVTVLWLGVIAVSFFRAGGILSVDPFFGTVNGISITSAGILMIVGIVFTVIFLVTYFSGRRGYCHVLCPIAVLMIAGRKIRNLFSWPALRLSADETLCIDCKKCSENCPMGLDVNGMVRTGTMENAECILCAGCADICPKGAIALSWKKK